MGGVVDLLTGGSKSASAPSYDNSAEVAAAATAERKRAAAATGRSSTVKTGGMGAEQSDESILKIAGRKAKLGA